MGMDSKILIILLLILLSSPSALAATTASQTITATLAIRYVVGNYWNATLTHKGNTYTELVIPAVAPLIGTFSDDDKDGYYLATVTLAFNP
jgi:hypothetical protein